MFEATQPEQQAVGTHWLVLLLPFITGLYLADFRQNTDGLLSILQFFSLLISLLWLSYFRFYQIKFLRTVLMMSSFFILGYWHMYFSQQEWQKTRTIKLDAQKVARFQILDVEAKKNGQLLFGTLSQVIKQQQQHVPIQIYTNQKLALHINDVMWVKIKVAPVENDQFPGAFDIERFLQFKGITHQAYLDSSQIQRVQNKAKSNTLTSLLKKQRNSLSKLFYSYLHGEAADIAVALIIGDRSGVDQRSKQAFQATGSMHIMAVSGMHIALLLNVLFKFFAFFGSWINRKAVIFLLLLLIWYYAFLTGLSAAVLRSVVMFSFLLLGQLSGRQVSSLLLLYFSAFCLLLFNPLLLFDLGFQLSYMAMWGIFVLYPKINAWFVFRWSYLQTLWEGTALGLAATLSTAPLTLYYFHSFPNYFALANLFLMSLSSFILIVGMLFPIFAAIPYLNQLLGYIFEKSLDLLLWIMDFFAQLPGAVVSGFTYHFIWVLLAWLALSVWSQEKQRHWRKYTYIFAMLFLAELSLQRLLQYHTNQVLLLSKEKVFVVKQHGQLSFFELKQHKSNHFLAQGFEAVYGVAPQIIKVKKQILFWHSSPIALKIYSAKKSKIAVLAKAQENPIQIY